ncbi:MAG: MaoC family dehydratase N-terminal domain-containing protein [Pseudomonadota bacterium]
MANGQWEDWVGTSQTLDDTCVPTPALAMAATLGRPVDFASDMPMPHPWLWLYFLPLASASDMGTDGHPKRGGFLPSIAQPRRMWAGSRMAMHDAARIGDPLTKVSTITAVTEKQGGAGEMVFVTVQHEVSAAGRRVLSEQQDIVYMNIPPRFTPPKAKPLPTDCDWTETVPLDPVLLFRFSALTFNGHRIHYDRPYAMDVENYPGLVVHGPLQAILLYDAACRQSPGKIPATFSFRGIHPLFEHDSVSLNGRMDGDVLELMTANQDGTICMQAKLTWAPA